MSNPRPVTGRPSHPFEHRTGRGETCEGCNSSYTRESYISGLYRCPKCEAYLEAHDRLLQSFGVMLEEWRNKFGLTRQGAIQQAEEFIGLYDDIQELLMSGYGLHDHEEMLDAEDELVRGEEAAKETHALGCAGE